MKCPPRWLILAAVLLGLVGGWQSWRNRHPFAFATGTPLGDGKVRPQLLTDGGSAVLLAPDGSLWGWGTDSCFPEGRVERPVRLGADADWVAIAGSLNFLLARKANGTLWTRGEVFYDQQAGLNVSQFHLTQVGQDTDWAAIAVTGMGGGFAMKESGAVWAWGRFHNDSGFDPVPRECGFEPDGVRITGDIVTRYVLRSDGTIWSRSPRQSPTGAIRLVLAQLGTDRDWAHTSSGGLGVRAIKRDGSLWQGGADASFNAVAEGQPAGPGKMVRIGTESDWSEVHDGGLCFYARRRDGSWWVSGENLAGRLGFSPHGRRWYFADPEKLPFTFDPWAFATGGKSTVLFARDGSVWSWGARLGVAPPSAGGIKFQKSFNDWSGRLPWRPKPFADPDAVWSHRPSKLWQWKPAEQMDPAR